jgi:hypothetical protein
VGVGGGRGEPSVLTIVKQWIKGFTIVKQWVKGDCEFLLGREG